MNYLKILVLGAVIFVPVAVNAQDRDREREQQQQVRRYEDKMHHDSHEWNDRENEAYRRYLQEHHRKYQAFDRAKASDQNNYWKWRHNHPDGDRR